MKIRIDVEYEVGPNFTGELLVKSVRVNGEEKRGYNPVMDPDPNLILVWDVVEGENMALALELRGV